MFFCFLKRTSLVRYSTKCRKAYLTLANIAKMLLTAHRNKRAAFTLALWVRRALMKLVIYVVMPKEPR
jgi:hypothetical protein